jgi:histidine ammonia-lyase
MTIVLTGNDLTLDEVVRVARRGEPVELAPESLERMRASRAVVEGALEAGQQIYGFTTGVGMRKRFAIDEGQAHFNR